MNKVLIILSVLLIIFFALVLYQRSHETIEKGISFLYNNQSTFLSYCELGKFKQHTFVTKRGDNYSGYDLTEILSSLNVIINNETDITFRSIDGGKLTINKLDKEHLYLVFTDNNIDQFVRLVIPSDEFSQRWIKYIKSIEII